MSLPFVAARMHRGGSFAAGPAAPVADTGVSEQDILDMGPVWWFDADRAYVEEGSGDPVETDGDNVTAWLDKSGNDRDFIGHQAGYYPHWYEADSNANDKPYVEFAYDRMRWQADDDYTTPMTFYWALADITTAQNAKEYYNGTKAISTAHHASAWPNGFYSNFGADGSNYYGTIQSTTPHILQYAATGSAVHLRVNGGAGEGVESSFGDPETNTLVSDTNYLTIDQPNAYMYEFLAIPNYTHEQDDVFSYLGDKYGITVSEVS